MNAVLKTFFAARAIFTANLHGKIPFAFRIVHSISGT